MTQSTYPTLPVLIVDDEQQFLLSASFTLNSEGIDNIESLQDSREVMARLASRRFSVVILDMNMPHLPGQELLPQIVRDFPDIPVVIITGVLDVETAVESMKTGAFDYLVKPVDDARLVTTIRRAIEYSNVRHENLLLKKYLLTDKLEHPQAFTDIITQNKSMRAIFQYMEAIAPNSLPVLITGETGVGKELVARAIHTLSGRRGKFVPVNVAGVDDSLFSDTLFGHQKGAFTGAERPRKGMIEQAGGGTLFLDEIGDLHIESQVKLLRLLQDGRYYPVGSDVEKVSNARILIATNQDIEAMMQSGKFRKDLYYRLQTHHIHIPPLRQRKDDIPLLVAHFLAKAAGKLDKKKPTAPPELFVLLENYSYPGNIRELEGMIYDAVSQHKSGVLSTATFREKIGHVQRLSSEGPDSGAADGDKGLAFPERLPTLKDMEQSLIDEALRRAHGNQTIAAEMLGMSRRALNNRLRRAEK